MVKTRLLAIFLILAGIGIGYFNYASETKQDFVFTNFPFKLGLDLQGGAHLIYQADTSNLKPAEIVDSMNSLRDVIERRINLFGVSEPLVQIQKKGIFKTEDARDYRLIVELPGVTDLKKAVAMIGRTPFLEFRTENPDGKADESFIPTELTGRYFEKAILEFNQTSFEPTVSLKFNKKGEALFAKITKENVGKRVAIYLDGAPISMPVVREEIKSGKAEISGGFTPQEAKILVGRLNSGALPVPIKLISEQSIGATLGQETLNKGVMAGVYGVLAVTIFLIVWYRLLGALAVLALSFYVALMLAIFKLFGVTLTAAGIAGFILSVGMAVDANILIFERIKEEIKQGKMMVGAISNGFARAWLSIRDANISSIITAVILFWFGTSLVKGFALTFGIGVFVSMFSAIVVTRTFLLALGIREGGAITKFLIKSGITK